MFEQGWAEGEDDTFNNVYKKDFIEVTGMKAHQKMRKMRGLHKKEPKETANPILEESMMYSAMIGVELLEGLAIVHDAVDRLVLEASERKVEVDRSIIQLRHQMGRRDNCIVVIDKWKADVTEHMRDIGEAQGVIHGRLTEVELCLTQLQSLVVAAHREVNLLGGVVIRQSEVINIQCQLLLEMEAENRQKFERLECYVFILFLTFGHLGPLGHLGLSQNV